MPITDENYLKKLFINDVKGTLGRYSGSSGSGPTVSEAVLKELVVASNGTYTPPNESLSFGSTVTFKRELSDADIVDMLPREVPIAEVQIKYDNGTSYGNIRISDWTFGYQGMIGLMLNHDYSSSDSVCYVFDPGELGPIVGANTPGWYRYTDNFDSLEPADPPSVSIIITELQNDCSIDFISNLTEEGGLELNVESTVTFKADLTDTGLLELFNDDTVQVNNTYDLNMFKKDSYTNDTGSQRSYTIFITDGIMMGLEVYLYEENYNTGDTREEYWIYMTPAGVYEECPSPGWYYGSPDSALAPCSPPSVTLPNAYSIYDVDADTGIGCIETIYMHLDNLAKLFTNVEPCDGYSKVTVNVPFDPHKTFRDVLNFSGDQLDLTYDMLEGVQAIPPYAFYDYLLGLIEIPTSVQFIGEYAFSLYPRDIYGGGGDTPSRTIKIPASVQGIENQAFSYTTIAELYCYGSTPPTNINDGQPFYYAKIETMYVPKGCTTVYDEWIRRGYSAQYPTIVEMEE